MADWKNIRDRVPSWMKGDGIVQASNDEVESLKIEQYYNLLKAYPRQPIQLWIEKTATYQNLSGVYWETLRSQEESGDQFDGIRYDGEPFEAIVSVDPSCCIGGIGSSIEVDDGETRIIYYGPTDSRVTFFPDHKVFVDGYGYIDDELITVIGDKPLTMHAPGMKIKTGDDADCPDDFSYTILRADSSNIRARFITKPPYYLKRIGLYDASGVKLYDKTYKKKDKIVFDEIKYPGERDRVYVSCEYHDLEGCIYEGFPKDDLVLLDEEGYPIIELTPKYRFKATITANQSKLKIESPPILEEYQYNDVAELIDSINRESELFTAEYIINDESESQILTDTTIKFDYKYYINKHLDYHAKAYGLLRRKYKENIPEYDLKYTYPPYYPYPIEQDYYLEERILEEYAIKPNPNKYVWLTNQDGQRVIKLTSKKSYDTEVEIITKPNHILVKSNDKVEEYNYTDPLSLYIRINRDSSIIKALEFNNVQGSLSKSQYIIDVEGRYPEHGLLKSEIFSYLHVIPDIREIHEDLLIWDEREWNEYLWAGDIYSPAVFEVQIPLDEIPKNIQLLSTSEIQEIINKTKSIGTYGYPAYYAEESLYLDFNDVYIRRPNHDLQYEGTLRLQNLIESSPEYVTDENGNEYLPNRQFQFRLDTEKMIAEGKLKPDASDIMIMDQSGRKYELGVNPVTLNTPETIFYLKVPRVYKGETQLIMKYGDPQLSGSLLTPINEFDIEDDDMVVEDGTPILWIYGVLETDAQGYHTHPIYIESPRTYDKWIEELREGEGGLWGYPPEYSIQTDASISAEVSGVYIDIRGTYTPPGGNPITIYNRDVSLETPPFTLTETHNINSSIPDGVSTTASVSKIKILSGYKSLGSTGYVDTNDDFTVCYNIDASIIGSGSSAKVQPLIVSASQGYRNPSGYLTSKSGGVAWVYPERILTENRSGARADTSPSNKATDYIWGKGYRFTIPSNAKITGVEARIVRKQSGTPSYTKVTDKWIQLYANSTLSSNKAKTSVYWPQDYKATTYGGSSDLWGYSSLTPAAVNNSNFALRLCAIANSTYKPSIYVDAMQLKVYYQYPKNPRTITYAAVSSPSTVWGSAKIGIMNPSGATIKVTPIQDTLLAGVGLTSEGSVNIKASTDSVTQPLNLPSYNIGAFTFTVKKVGNPTDNLRVEFIDSYGAKTIRDIPSSKISTGYTEIDIPIDVTVTDTPAQIKIYRAGSTDNSNYYVLQTTADTNNTYFGGLIINGSPTPMRNLTSSLYGFIRHQQITLPNINGETTIPLNLTGPRIRFQIDMAAPNPSTLPSLDYIKLNYEVTQ